MAYGTDHLKFRRRCSIRNCSPITGETGLFSNRLVFCLVWFHGVLELSLSSFRFSEKTVQFRSYSIYSAIYYLQSSSVYYLPRIQCSRISHRAFLLTSISSVSFHFSFGLNITSVEFYTLKLAKQTCTSIQNITFFIFRNHNDHAMHIQLYADFRSVTAAKIKCVIQSIVEAIRNTEEQIK